MRSTTRTLLVLAAVAATAALGWSLRDWAEPAAVGNVALGKPVTADSVYDRRYPPENAVDGDRRSVSSRWLSARSNRLDWSQQPHWLEIDLGAPHRVSGMGFWAGAQDSYKWAPVDFRFQAWQDHGWRDLVTASGNVEPVYRADFEPQETTRVRLIASRGSDPGALRLYEVEVYGIPRR